MTLLQRRWQRREQASVVKVGKVFRMQNYARSDEVVRVGLTALETWAMMDGCSSCALEEVVMAEILLLLVQHLSLLDLDLRTMAASAAVSGNDDPVVDDARCRLACLVYVLPAVDDRLLTTTTTRAAAAAAVDSSRRTMAVTVYPDRRRRCS